jgi:hypothetical protein
MAWWREIQRIIIAKQPENFAFPPAFLGEKT